MKRRVGVASALALITSSVGMTTPVHSQSTGTDAEQCEILLQTEDRGALQAQLTSLLQEDPNNICIDVIVGVLGGSPVALVPAALPY